MNFLKKNNIKNNYAMSTMFSKFFAIALLFLTTSCFLAGGIKGNRNVVSQDRSIASDFDAIRSSHGIDVQLTIGSEVSLRVEADENLHDVIRTEVEDGVLRIYSKKNVYSSKKRTVYVTANEMNEIRATSGSSVTSENTIKTEDLIVKTTSGAHVNLTVDTENTSCSSTSGSNIRLSGKTDKLTASSTSGANVKAKDLEAKICEARATSGSVMSVYASQELDAKATSGGNIRCSGDPEVVKKNSSSGGSIRS